MTLGILALDGADWRLARDVDLFRHVPVTSQELTNDLDDHPRDLFTPRVWTHVFAGAYQDRVDGWLSADAWRDATANLTFLWDRVPAMTVHDLRVHKEGLTRSEVYPDNWASVATNTEDRKTTANARAMLWNQDLANQPPILASWFGFPDRQGHHCLKNGDALRPAYVWMRDELFPQMDWPDELLVLSDHGIRLDGGDDAPHAGMDAHERRGVLAASDGVDGVLKYGRLSTFIPGWQEDVTAYLRDRHLDRLGYR